MIRFYYYKHPDTGKIYSEQRMKGFENKPYVSPDGKKCEIIKDYIPFRKNRKSILGIIDKNAEVFEKDPKYVRECNPKYIRLRNGRRVRYDPNKHY